MTVQMTLKVPMKLEYWRITPPTKVALQQQLGPVIKPCAGTSPNPSSQAQKAEA